MVSKIKRNKVKQIKNYESDPAYIDEMATSGLFNPEFLESLRRAERDIVAGRITKLKSLKDLRK